MTEFDLNTFVKQTQERNSLAGVKIKRKNLSTVPCQYPDCSGYSWAQGYCSSHYQKLRKQGVIKSRRILNNPVRRYYSKIEVNPDTLCWEWQGAVHQRGYPIMPIGGKGKPFKVHRFAYEMFFGAIPDGLVVMHSCDNRKCSNPAHLSLGTQKENMQDASTKGRLKRNQSSPLPTAWRRQMRILYARGTHSIYELASIYQVNEERVRLLLKGHTHLEW